MKPLIISSGEPAGIGPDVCLGLLPYGFPVVIAIDERVLIERAKQLNLNLTYYIYDPNDYYPRPGVLYIHPVVCDSVVVSGVLAIAHAEYVMKLLTLCAQSCMDGIYSGIVTAPIHKGILNEAGYSFSGHTEFFQNYYAVDQVVMMLMTDTLKVALATTHLPLRAVPDALTSSHLEQVIRIIHHDMQIFFGYPHPWINVAGLNPHAGEGGYLGREEIEVIAPTLEKLRQEGFCLIGPTPADTWFIGDLGQKTDVFLAMYHDQGLPLIKFSDFSGGVNVTLGLPIIRTSVDHGTALSLAGRGQANASSLCAAIKCALSRVHASTNQRNL